MSAPAAAADPLAGKEAAATKRCLAVLKQAAATPSFLPPPPRTGRGGATASGNHQQQLNLVDTLAALRCLRLLGGASDDGTNCSSALLHCKLQTAVFYESHQCLPVCACVCLCVVCRELAHMYAPLSLVAMPDLKECLGKLKGHQVRSCRLGAGRGICWCWETGRSTSTGMGHSTLPFFPHTSSQH